MIITIDHFVTSVDKLLVHLGSKIRLVSENWRLKYQSVEGRLGLNSVRNDGGIQASDGRLFDVFDLSGFGEREIRALVQWLHQLGPKSPFKIIWEAKISGSQVGDHVSWLLSNVTENREKYKAVSPKAEVDYDTLLGWYLETAESIRKGHRTLRPLLIIHRPVANALEWMSARRLGQAEETLFLLGLFDDLSDWNIQSYRDTQIRLGKMPLLQAVAPDAQEFFRDGKVIRTVKQALWSGANQRESYYVTLTVHSPPDLNALRGLLLPLIDGARRFYLSCAAAPVPDRRRTRFLSLAGKRMRRITGIDQAKSQIFKSIEKGASHQDANISAIGAGRDKYRQKVEETISTVKAYDRQCFRSSVLTLVLKSTDKKDLEQFREQVEGQLNDQNIWVEMPESWQEQEQNFLHVLPRISDVEVREESLPVPVADFALVDELQHREVPFQREGILLGVVEDAQSLGTPLSVKLGVLACHGTHSTGKTTVGKIIASYARLADPGRRVVVVDYGAATTSEDDQLGWRKMSQMFGGEVVYSQNHESPQDLLTSLLAIEASRFIVYYPDENRRENDLAFFQWLRNAMERFADPVAFSEGDVQQVVVLDDISPLAADPLGRNNRLRFLAQFVIPQFLATGTLAVLTMPTAGAIEKADQASHDNILNAVTGWFNFQTPSYMRVPGSIGILSHTPETEALSRQLTSGLAGIATPGIGSPEDKGRCIVSMKNVETVGIQILVSPSLLTNISRMVVK